MTDLTKIITGPQHAAEAATAKLRKPRGWLGLSEIGAECGRTLWYSHHGADSVPPDGRALRLFAVGDYIEDKAIADLRLAGFDVHSQQRRVVVESGGVTLRGHIDGIVEGLVESSKAHLFECKSANQSNYNALVKCGSYEKWNEKYKCQVQVYMTLLGLDRALVWVENKDNSKVYTERVRLDKDYAVKRMERAFKIISAPVPPDRKCPKATWFEAKFCKHREVCFV